MSQEEAQSQDRSARRWKEQRRGCERQGGGSAFLHLDRMPAHHRAGEELGVQATHWRNGLAFCWLSKNSQDKEGNRDVEGQEIDFAGQPLTIARIYSSWCM